MDVEPKATSNTKLEVTRDVKSISATTNAQVLLVREGAECGKVNVGDLLLLTTMVVRGPQLCHHLIHVMEVYTLDGHGDFVEDAMYKIQWLNQDLHLTRNLHLIKTVKEIVCGYTVSQGPVESRQRNRTKRSLCMQSSSGSV